MRITLSAHQDALAELPRVTEGAMAGGVLPALLLFSCKKDGGRH
ncbi:hypothetical protein [Neolewinella sp.]